MFSLWKALINSSMLKEAKYSESAINPSGAINKTDKIFVSLESFQVKMFHENVGNSVYNSKQLYKCFSWRQPLFFSNF